MEVEGKRSVRPEGGPLPCMRACMHGVGAREGGELPRGCLAFFFWPLGAWSRACGREEGSLEESVGTECCGRDGLGWGGGVLESVVERNWDVDY